MSILHSDALTLQELRAKLAQSLHQNGVVDKLKSQLRARLVAELRTLTNDSIFQKELNDEEITDPEANKLQDSTLWNQALDSVVAEYMKTRGLEFTLGVFLPESGLKNVLSESDVVDVLRINRPKTTLENLYTLVQSEASTTSLLTRLLKSLATIASVERTNKECQTGLGAMELLEVKLSNIDKEFTPAMTSAVLESRISQLKEEYNKQLEERLASALTQMRETEIAQMRLEEKNKHFDELKKLEKEYEEKEQERIDRWKEWEAQIKQRLDNQETEAERRMYEGRQDLLNQLDLTKAKEDNARKEAEQLKQEISKLTQQKETRESELTAALNDAIQHIRELQSSQSVEPSTEPLSKSRSHLNLLSRQDEMQQRISEQTDRIALLESQLTNSEREKEEYIHRLNKEITSSAEVEQLKVGLQQAESLAQKRLLDYTELSQKLQHQKSNDKDSDQFSKLRASERKWQLECQQLIVRLEMEMNKTDELQNKFDDEVLRNKELKRELTDLRLLLHQTQTALANELAHHENLRLQLQQSQAANASHSTSFGLPDPYAIFAESVSKPVRQDSQRSNTNYPSTGIESSPFRAAFRDTWNRRFGDETRRIPDVIARQTANDHSSNVQEVMPVGGLVTVVPDTATVPGTAATQRQEGSALNTQLSASRVDLVSETKDSGVSHGDAVLLETPIQTSESTSSFKALSRQQSKSDMSNNPSTASQIQESSSQDLKQDDIDTEIFQRQERQRQLEEMRVAELERIRQEKEKLLQEEEEAQRMTLQKKEKSLPIATDSQTRLSETVVVASVLDETPPSEDVVEPIAQIKDVTQEDEKDKKLKALEVDPVLQKYMDMIKERRAHEGSNVPFETVSVPASAKQDAAATVFDTDLKFEDDDLVIEAPSVKFDSKSDSIDFGAGNTDESASGVVFTDTNSSFDF